MTASNIIVVFNIIHEAVLELFKCRGQSSASSIKYVAKKTTICHSQDRIFPWMTNSDEVLPCFAVTFLSSSKCFICLKWWWPSVWKMCMYSNFSCRFLNPNCFFQLNSNCFNVSDMRDLQEQVERAFCFKRCLLALHCSNKLF